MSGHNHAQLVAVDRALGGVDPHHLAAITADAGDFALLDYIHAHRRAGPRIAPGHRIMARRTAARLIKRAQNRIARSVKVDDRHQFLDLGRFDPFGRHALQVVCINGAAIAAHLVMGLRQHQKPARAEHHVVVQILAQSFEQAPRLFIDRRRGVLQIVRADDRRVPPGIATAKPALLDDGHVGDAVILAKVIGRGEPMTTRANDDHIVFLLRRRAFPGLFPVLVIAHRLAGNGKDRIAFHRHGQAPDPVSRIRLGRSTAPRF